MNLKKVNILLLVLMCFFNINSVFRASESEVDDRFKPKSTLDSSVKKAASGTNFNGSVMISQNDSTAYDVIYSGAVGENGGYDVDTIYDVGSISKLYTTTAIMTLQEAGKLQYSDPISKYISGVPEDKAGITIKMLLTHTSGIYAEENDDHNVTKEDELKRILQTDLSFEPGTNYRYSNAGFTLLAAIIEQASGFEYEEYLETKLFDSLGLTSTGFPNSFYLKEKAAVSGKLDGVTYGKVTNFDFGWYSKGYADVLTTPRELTYFFQALISGKILGTENLKLMNLNEVDLGSDQYRGYGTDIKHYGSDKQVVGHTGIWYGGNSVVYYRPSDKILFVLMCDQVTVSSDLPANYVFNTLNAMYPSGDLNGLSSDEAIEIADLLNTEEDLADLNYDVEVSEKNNNELIEPLSKGQIIANIPREIDNILKDLSTHRIHQLIAICLILIVIVGLTLTHRIKSNVQA